MQAKKYPAVGKCIYCGAEEYAPGSTRRFGDEHIIPDGLGGRLILPEASCKKCERITNQFETPILKGIFHVVRKQLGIPSKKKRDPDKVTYVTELNGKLQYVTVDPKDYPGIIFTYTFFRPRILDGQPLLDDIIGCGMAGGGIEGLNWELPPEWFQGGTISLPPIRKDASALNLMRMLAKIAHSFAVAEGKIQSVRPLLLPLILGDDLKHAWHYVGGTYEEKPPRTDELFAMFLKDEVSPDGKRYLVADIRLYSHISGMPRYLVVIGEYPSDLLRCEP
ncbi:HNH endonuclease [Roseiarcaceae bacterium H3SJ34-1]|uniref:hypothetical protein n=1 Tax=Terripilifer ovatus TaxID=3032367 RepID=UPI003AB9969F|nr:HNH endonuclease [Roseiarcaceae bacterium H3SJ34-1]